MSAHAEFLRAASKDTDLATRLKDDYRTASLTEQDRRMLEFVDKLTLSPWLLTSTDIASLRTAGFPDIAILQIVLGCAHFNYLNRMADGIGIRFEYHAEIPAVPPRSSNPETRVARPYPNSLDSRPSGSAWVAFEKSTKQFAQSNEPQNLYHAMSANPEARDLAQEWRRYQLKGTTQLDASLRSQLGLYVSSLNHCEYSSYAFRNRIETVDSSGARLASGELPQDLSTRDEVLFTHARRLTQEPSATTEKHIHQLRQAGLDDRGILQLTMLCSYFSFENRVALALGVQTERESR